MTILNIYLLEFMLSFLIDLNYVKAVFNVAD